MSTETPLFIPMVAKFYDAFANGTKTVEYRRGPRWDTRICRIGRRVTIITGFHYDHLAGSRLPGWRECYPDGGVASCITIQLDKFNPTLCPTSPLAPMSPPATAS
jgi:hypothetical protein